MNKNLLLSNKVQSVGMAFGGLDVSVGAGLLVVSAVVSRVDQDGLVLFASQLAVAVLADGFRVGQEL